MSVLNDGSGLSENAASPADTAAARVRNRMGAAKERSRRAREIALRHQALAEARTGPLRDMHARVAVLHWRMEQRQLVTLRLYGSVLLMLQRPGPAGPGPAGPAPGGSPIGGSG